MIFSLLSLSNLERFNCHRSGGRRRINWARTRFELGLSAPLGDPLARLHGLRVRALGRAGGQSLRILSFCSGHHTVELLEVDCLCHRARAVAPCEGHLEWGEEREQSNPDGWGRERSRVSLVKQGHSIKSSNLKKKLEIKD